MDILYLVVPCFNEQEVLNETAKQLEIKMTSMIERKLISKDSKILFVDDGSKDETWEIIKYLNGKNKLFYGLTLAHNSGHQFALLAGLMEAKKICDMAISLDADLQDDINVIDKFVEKYYEGNDIVYGVRKSRKADTKFKRISAEGFYKVMGKLGVEIVYNHADYRLMSKRALNALENYKEVNLFLRGIVPIIGFKSDTVEYDRKERFAGESKYPLKKMMSFALNGITSFSIKPIRFITALGFGIFIVSIAMLLYFLITYLMGSVVEGWTSIVVSVWAIGGLQLLSIGVIGEYIGKIYMESKARPRYIIEEIIGK